MPPADLLALCAALSGLAALVMVAAVDIGVRPDLSGAERLVWLALVTALPLLGPLAYLSLRLLRYSADARPAESRAIQLALPAPADARLEPQPQPLLSVTLVAEPTLEPEPDRGVA